MNAIACPLIRPVSRWRSRAVVAAARVLNRRFPHPQALSALPILPHLSGSTGSLDVQFSPTVPGLALAASYGNCGAVFRSVDGGSSWTNSLAGFGCYDQYVVSFDPTQPNVVYAGSYFGGGRVFKSIDLGVTWVSLPGTPPSSAGAVRSIVVDPADPAHLFVGTEYSGIFESESGGSSWTQLANGPSGCVCEVLAADPLDADTLHARQFGGGVEFTMDGGATWADTCGHCAWPVRRRRGAVSAIWCWRAA